MADYQSLAINDIRAYLWEQLVAADILNENDYYADGFDAPLIPIIPAQQVPEFNNLLPGKTYIVYDYEVLPIQQDWWNIDESVDFMILSTQYDEIQKIMNFMTDIFRRYDDSATEVRNSNILSNNFIFHYTAVTGIKSPQAMKHEAGLRMGQITIFYCYNRIEQDLGRF